MYLSINLCMYLFIYLSMYIYLSIYVFMYLSIYLIISLSVWCGTGGVVARWHVSRSVWQYMVAIALAYFVTLCLYPGIVTEVASFRLGSWMPVVMMATFNLFDFIGKVRLALLMRREWLY